jgi:hypothetical protein
LYFDCSQASGHGDYDNNSDNGGELHVDIGLVESTDK